MGNAQGILVALLLLATSFAAVIPAEEPQEAGAPGFRPLPFTPPPWIGEMAPSAPAPGTAGRAVTLPPPETQKVIGKVAGSVSKEYLLAYLTKLQGVGSRYCRAPGMAEATLWLYDALQGNGRMKAEFHNFSYINSSGYTHWIRSVILTLPGLNPSSDRVWYMMNHADATLSFPSPTYDELMSNAPGADDDASGVAATLEAARVLSRFGFEDTIRFAFFNGEEIGLLGSYYWAQMMYSRGENIQGFIDYDMIGYSVGSYPYDLVLEYNTPSEWEAQYLAGVNSRYGLGLSIYPYLANGPIGSDVYSFYYFGFPGVMGIEYDFSPYYHTMLDRVEYLNTTLIGKCTKLAVSALCEMARMLYTDAGIVPGNLTASNYEPGEGEAVTLTANITNSGNLNASNLEVAFYADGFPFISKRIWVPANGTNTTSVTWQATIGRHQMSVVLDPNNEQPESDRSNNYANLTVTVNDRPRAVLSAVPLSAHTNETILFNGSLSSDVAGVDKYSFDFGDGNTTGWIPSPTAAHAYERDGSYTASLQVADIKGALSEPARLTVQVHNRGPSASPSSNPARARTFEPVQFASNASDPDGTFTVHWDFGDGGISTEPDPVHNYSKSGIYLVQLTVQDDDGAAALFSLQVIIGDRSPECSIDLSPSEGTIETEFKLTANASDPDGTIASYEWELGDGSIAVGKATEHTYTRPGSYIVRLAVRDDDGSEARALTLIEVVDRPPVSLADASTNETDTFRRIRFSGYQSHDLEGPITFSWDFGDGNASTETSPYHAYSRPGYYNVTLTVQDTAGQNATAALPAIRVRNQLPAAQFRFFGCFTQNGTVIFDGTGSSDPEGPMTYSWDFGDNRTALGGVVEHVFPAAGNYTVNLTVTDGEGDTNSLAQLVMVYPPPPPPPSIKPPEPEDKTGTVNLLLGLNVLLIILLAAAAIWAVSRGRKAALAEPETLEMEPPLENSSSLPPAGEPMPPPPPPDYYRQPPRY